MTDRFGRGDIVLEVLEALAEADSVSVNDLDYTLYDYVDPAVLTGLAGMTDAEWSFSVRVADHLVTIESDGRLYVDGVLVKSNLSVGDSPW